MEGSILLRETGQSVGEWDENDMDWSDSSLYRIIRVTGSPCLIYVGTAKKRNNDVLETGDTVSGLGVNQLKANGIEIKILPKVPWITICLGHFQKFDKGKIVKEIVPEEYDLQPGEIFHWECAQFYGLAEVVSRNDTLCCIKKVS
jgi:hypothetical protein